MSYRARDLLLLPGLLSLARIPLAVCFPLVLRWPIAAFAVLVAAGLSDVLDGWWARTHGQVTATGAALDPITDKLFVLTVAITMVAGGYLSATDVLLLSTRELGELPLVLWYATSHRARKARAEHPSANAAGKVATALQFITVSDALVHGHAGALREPLGFWLLVVTAIAGVWAAALYWRRAIATGKE